MLLVMEVIESINYTSIPHSPTSYDVGSCAARRWKDATTRGTARGSRPAEVVQGTALFFAARADAPGAGYTSVN